MTGFDWTAVLTKFSKGVQSLMWTVAVLILLAFLGLAKAGMYGLILAMPGLALAWAAVSLHHKLFPRMAHSNQAGAVAGTYALDRAHAPPQLMVHRVALVDSARITSVTWACGAVGAMGMACMAWWINGHGANADEPSARVIGGIIAAILLLAGLKPTHSWLEEKASETAQWSEPLKGLQPLINQCHRALGHCAELAKGCSLPVNDLDWAPVANRIANTPVAPQHEGVENLLKDKLAELHRLSKQLQAFHRLGVDALLAVREATAVSLATKNSAAVSFMAQTAALICPQAIAAAYQTHGLEGAKQIVAAATAQARALLGQSKGESHSADSKSQPIIATPLDALHFLGLEPHAPARVLKAEVRRLRAFYHPDRLSSLTPGKRSEYEEKIKLINRAHELLAREGMV